MPKAIQITLPSEEAPSFIYDIEKLPGLISLSRQQNVSLKPKGDIVGVKFTDDRIQELMRFLDKHGMLRREDVSITTSQPLSIMSQPHSKAIRVDSSEATWEEMLGSISRESNMTVNSLLIMFVAGVLASIGIATNALHLVVAAMVLAPGFLPIVRISLGIVTSHQDWQRGVTDTIKAYLAMFAGAVITTLVLLAAGKTPDGGESSYLPAGVLISYWTSITLPSLIVTAVASIVGAIVVITNRSVLTAGVMIALALVPTITITAIAIVTGDLEMAQKAIIRWAIEVAFVGIFSGITFMWKKASKYKRNMAA